MIVIDGVDPEVVRLTSSLRRAERWSARADVCGRMGMWTVKLYVICILPMLWLVCIGEPGAALAFYNLIAPSVVLSAVLIGLMLVIGIPATLWQARCHRALTDIALRKDYPRGCTCIVGALLDNPRCPHHGGEP